jgi:cytochrome c-type biogenesis protein CcmE
MKLKTIIGIALIIFFIIFGAYSFIESNVSYVTINEARKTHRIVQIVGEWVKDMESYYDARLNQFVFYLEDEEGEIIKVIYNGAKPNNFEIATGIVVKGRYKDGIFEAKEILTKCPSKYQDVNALESYRE